MAKLDEISKKEKNGANNKANDDSKLLGRELVYIDIDDDVTSIISKIKQSQEPVVGLIPPKRAGVLQSVVNLKLLQRAAKQADKKISIITTNKSLVNLASGLALPVAKNINSQAKIPENNTEEDISDVIDGQEDNVVTNLAVTKESKSQAQKAIEEDDGSDKEISAAVAAIETDDKFKDNKYADSDLDKKPTPSIKKIKVPSVDGLRNRLIIGTIVALFLFSIGFWAFVIAPNAVITIKAKTRDIAAEKSLSLVPSTDLEPEKGIIAPVIKQKKENESIKIDATGQKEVGERAKGVVAFCYPVPLNDPYSDTPRKNEIVVPAGTTLYVGGVQFATDAPIKVRGGKTASSGNTCAKDRFYAIKATAVNIGESGNIGPDKILTVAGFSNLNAYSKGSFSGGSHKTIKVVQQSDVDSAVQKLKERVSGKSGKVKDDLQSQISSSTMVITNSFNVRQSQLKLDTQVGQEPKGDGANASIEITYTLVGVNKSDLKKITKKLLDKEVDNQKEKVYAFESSTVAFSDFVETDNGYTVKLKTKGYAGPTIDKEYIKKGSLGKKSEEIKQWLKQTNGVGEVDVKMSPFWVSTVSSEQKVKINFAVSE